MVVEHIVEEEALHTVEVVLHTGVEEEHHTVAAAVEALHIEVVERHTVEEEEHHTAGEALHTEVVEHHTVEEGHQSLAEERGQANRQIQANLAPVQEPALEEVHVILAVEVVRDCIRPADGFGKLSWCFLGGRMGRSLEQDQLCLDFHDHVAETTRHVGYLREQASIEQDLETRS